MGRKVKFYKYQGTGNDFIILDQWDKEYNLTTDDIAYLCDRRMGIGADGLMYLRKASGVDFVMIYFNADGNESTMCGNGGRCISSLFFSRMNKSEARFQAIDGLHYSKLLKHGHVSLHMSDVKEIKDESGGYFLNTGSPHIVLIKENVETMDVEESGSVIRFSPTYADEGVNVNFMEIDPSNVLVRTYERGVEGETLSCGTGVTACAIVAGMINARLSGSKGIEIKTKGGILKVNYQKHEEMVTDIWLTGPTQQVFTGEIEI
ncbi:MAG: diaminopimelate epimerase [Saprospiraceae bacterium]|nr:diaminopimelate epimerase [Saprospiraceae bacterium]